MKYRLASPLKAVCGAGAALLLALQCALAQGAPAPEAAAQPPAPAHAAPAQTPVLAAHRALYELTLADAGAGSNVTGIYGQLVYDFHGSACEGYTLNTRLITQVIDRQGKASMSDVRTESWEDGEGRRLRFSTAQYTDGKLADATKGTARRSGKTIIVALEKPQRTSIVLSGNILFPAQHSLAMLRTAMAGQRRLQADIYDGSEKGTKVYETTTVIGPPLELSANAQLPAAQNAGALDTIPSWPVVVSYFEQGEKKDGLPAYEVSFRMYANGVSRKLKLDYGTFSLEGELSSLEFFETKPCP